MYAPGSRGGAGSPEAVDRGLPSIANWEVAAQCVVGASSGAGGELEPLLRTYEGCTRSYLGEIEDATLVKIHRCSGKVSYLAYPEFDSDPHPALLRAVKLNLRNLWLDVWDYAGSENPPILHRKEAFLAPEDSRYAKFARLTQQEERRGLLDETRRDWHPQRLERPAVGAGAPATGTPGG